MKTKTEVADFIMERSRPWARSVHVSRVHDAQGEWLIVWVESISRRPVTAKRAIGKAFDRLPPEVRGMSRLIVQKEEWDTWQRGSGDMRCESCLMDVYSHPPSRSDGDVLHRLCDGRKVKT